MAEVQDSDAEAPSSTETEARTALSRSKKKAPDPGTGGVVTESVRLLRRNPELAKVIICVGFQMAAADVAPTIDLGPDTNQTWGRATSEYECWFEIASATVASLTAPTFGAFTDLVDRRVAVGVYGFISFLPTFIYWCFFPLGPSVVWASHYAAIAAAVGRSSNVLFALATDVTAFEDRALATGLYYGLTNLLLMLLSVVPSSIVLLFNPLGINTFLGNHQYVILLYQTGLVVAFVVSLFWLAKPKKQGAEDSSLNADAQNDSQEEANLCRCAGLWLEDAKLVVRHPRLFRLMVAAFFLSISQTLSQGNDGQFFAESLGLYKKNKSLLFDQMNVLRSVGSVFVYTPAYILAGYLSMSRGTLKVLRGLVPLTAVVMAFGGFAVLIPSLWIVPIIVAVQNTGDLYQVPLMRMATGVAMPGRVGTWLTLVGMAIEAGNIIASFVIIIINTLLCKNKDTCPLWIYYPAAGVVAMCAAFSVWGTPKSSIGWGAAAGTCKEQFNSMMLAKQAGRKWIERTRGGRRPGNLSREASSDAGPSETTESDSHDEPDSTSEENSGESSEGEAVRQRVR